MKNKTRLRIHIAYDLFGARLTPSTRLRDPYSAKKPTAHILTFHQLDLWNTLVPNSGTRVVDVKNKTLIEVVNEITARLPEKGKAKLIQQAQTAVLEIIAPR